jgi:spermidine synthase
MTCIVRLPWPRVRLNGVSGAPRIADDAGRSVLLVDGVIQSVSPADAERWGSYWAAMVPPFAPKRGLILGLGGATLPHLIVRRWGSGASLVGVDDDPRVLRLAEEAGWLQVAGLQPVGADAFAFVRTNTARFDYVAVDLYRGAASPARMLARPFLRALSALLEPPAWLTMNLYASAASPGRMTTVRALFHIEHQLYVGENLVLHLRPRDGISRIGSAV